MHVLGSKIHVQVFQINHIIIHFVKGLYVDDLKYVGTTSIKKNIW